MSLYTGAQIAPMAQPFKCKYFLQLNMKFFNVEIRDVKGLITFEDTVLLEMFSVDVLTVFIPSEFGILVYKALMSMDTKFGLSSYVSVVLNFRKKSFVSSI